MIQQSFKFIETTAYLLNDIQDDLNLSCLSSLHAHYRTKANIQVKQIGNILIQPIYKRIVQNKHSEIT